MVLSSNSALKMFCLSQDAKLTSLTIQSKKKSLSLYGYSLKGEIINSETFEGTGELYEDVVLPATCGAGQYGLYGPAPLEGFVFLVAHIAGLSGRLVALQFLGTTKPLSSAAAPLDSGSLTLNGSDGAYMKSSGKDIELSDANRAELCIADGKFSLSTQTVSLKDLFKELEDALTTTFGSFVPQQGFATQFPIALQTTQFDTNLNSFFKG